MFKLLFGGGTLGEPTSETSKVESAKDEILSTGSHGQLQLVMARRDGSASVR